MAFLLCPPYCKKAIERSRIRLDKESVIPESSGSLYWEMIAEESSKAAGPWAGCAEGPGRLGSVSTDPKLGAVETTGPASNQRVYVALQLLSSGAPTDFRAGIQTIDRHESRKYCSPSGKRDCSGGSPVRLLKAPRLTLVYSAPRLLSN
jgi:hypothetical protein